MFPVDSPAVAFYKVRFIMTTVILVRKTSLLTALSIFAPKRSTRWHCEGKAQNEEHEKAYRRKCGKLIVTFLVLSFIVLLLRRIPLPCRTLEVRPGIINKKLELNYDYVDSNICIQYCK